MRRFFRRLMFWGIFLVSVLLIGFLFFRSYYRSLMQDLAQTQVKNATSDLTNDAISKLMLEGDIQYDRIVYFEKDLDGKITALKTNIGEVNRLKTDILKIINDEILALDSTDLGIPLGSILIPEILSGKGPIIPVRILMIRNSDATFSSRFTHAGINQTLHQLIMEISVDVALLVLGKTSSFTIVSEVVAAETVIVGDVPQTFLQSASFND